ncbi:MAG: sel1 repeat family protein [Holosporales bacterium]|nr:sel1 repeat family protein [Holosporales bacterium]
MKKFLRDSASAIVLSFLTASFPAGAMEKDGEEISIGLPAAVAASSSHKDLSDRDVVDFKKLAEQGDPEATYQLARHYLEGRGVEKNLALAHVFFGTASRMGHVDAHYIFGLMLLKGEGCSQDRKGAHLSLCLAAAQGHGKAREALVEHFSEMSGEPSEVDFLTLEVLKMTAPASSSEGGNQ